MAVAALLARIVVCGFLLAAGASAAHAAGPVLTFGKPEDVKVKVKKPEAEGLFDMANLRPEYKLELRESFLPQVTEALTSKPF